MFSYSIVNTFIYENSLGGGFAWLTNSATGGAISCCYWLITLMEPASMLATDIPIILSARQMTMGLVLAFLLMWLMVANPAEFTKQLWTLAPSGWPELNFSWH